MKSFSEFLAEADYASMANDEGKRLSNIMGGIDFRWHGEMWLYPGSKIRVYKYIQSTGDRPILYIFVKLIANSYTAKYAYIEKPYSFNGFNEDELKKESAKAFKAKTYTIFDDLVNDLRKKYYR